VVEHTNEVVIRNALDTDQRSLFRGRARANVLDSSEVDTTVEPIQPGDTTPDMAPGAFDATLQAEPAPYAEPRASYAETSPRRAIHHGSPAPSSSQEVHLAVVLGRVLVTEYRFNGGVISIGRDSNHDVVLENPSVSRLHSKIRYGGQGFSIEDMKTPNGTTVNGKDIRSAWLRPGDEIGIGKVTLLFQPSKEQLARLDRKRITQGFAGHEEHGATQFLTVDDIHRVKRERAEERDAHIKVLQADGRLGRRIPLRRGTTVLGRSPSSDIRLQGWFIGERHALIVQSGETFKLVHSGGLRPVTVNGVAVRERVLRNRDRIRIGKNVLSFFGAA
jgi:pSer/pThr/pTyr-binding forkhead associated (FHA) protein